MLLENLFHSVEKFPIGFIANIKLNSMQFDQIWLAVGRWFEGAFNITNLVKVMRYFFKESRNLARFKKCEISPTLWGTAMLEVLTWSVSRSLADIKRHVPHLFENKKPHLKLSTPKTLHDLFDLHPSLDLRDKFRLLVSFELNFKRNTEWKDLNFGIDSI